MIRRALLIVAGVLVALGGALIYEAHSIRAEIPSIRTSERQLQPAVAADRARLGSFTRRNQVTATRLVRARRDVRALLSAQATVERAAWKLAFDPARAAAYPAAYDEAFPLALGSSDWYIVHAVRRGEYETTTWDAPEGHEYVIEAGTVTPYALGEAPSPYLTVPNEGYYNSDGIWVPSPSTDPGLTPAGPTALCADGTYSYSLNHSGTCSWHGGVAEWLDG